MPVDDEINLNNPDGLTQEDIDRMNEMADEVQRIAERTENNVGKIGVSAGGDIESRLAQIEENQKKFIALLSEGKTEREENKRKLTEAEKERQEMLKEFKHGSSEASRFYGEMNSLRNDPMSFGRGKIKNILGKAGIYGAVATFVWEMGERLYNQVLSEIKGMYGKGGVFDIRKTVEDSVTEYNSIKYLTQIKNGQVIFTADAGQDLVQGAIRGAYNTRDLRDGHLRYFQLKRGS